MCRSGVRKSGLFAPNRESSVCVSLRGGAGRCPMLKPTWRCRDQLSKPFAWVAPPNRGSLNQRPHLWHSRAGGGAVQSAKGGKSKGGESKSAKAGGKNAKGGKGTKSAKGDASDDSDGSDSKFGKVTDLSGKRVGVVSGNEATTGLLELVLSHYGVPRDKVTISSID